VLCFTPLRKGKLCIYLPLTDKHLHCDLYVRPCCGKSKYSAHTWNTKWHARTQTHTHTHITILCRQHSHLHCPTHCHGMMLNYTEDNSSFALPLMKNLLHRRQKWKQTTINISIDHKYLPGTMKFSRLK